MDAYDHGSRPRQAALRKGRVSLPNQCYFITKCTLPHMGPFLAEPGAAEIVANCLLWARDHAWWRILGFCIMPGHYHMAVALGTTKTLSEAVAGVDKFTATQANRLLSRQGGFWEAGYYDHAIRDRRDLDTILEYMHQNPVVAALADRAESWDSSTAHPRYAGEIDWDWLGPSLVAVSDSRHRFREDDIPLRYR